MGTGGSSLLDFLSGRLMDTVRAGRGGLAGAVAGTLAGLGLK